MSASGIRVEHVIPFKTGIQIFFHTWTPTFAGGMIWPAAMEDDYAEI
jgi:hypothetical protein